ncbi:protein serine/threonine kinase, putative [Entamoeba invadens IP1]|uniref:Protein serine/threonine kinase, putative n=1 Tax=Entamoeba invadens IP1 TaxID=370355 RepID=A0A0A1U6L9_ENTIV|nr:protein serine/threonine kinase, putative [Entamoeba invadens IP1]ELP89960.1 protein serine/threonine kinase, putative [Entamoeba invadens IP1]|eukprot:XP_004256731.1 protein serine/threonine kinase, putative [Entamoeba invadens IP1]
MTVDNSYLVLNNHSKIYNTYSIYFVRGSVVTLNGMNDSKQVETISFNTGRCFQPCIYEDDFIYTTVLNVTGKSFIEIRYGFIFVNSTIIVTNRDIRDLPVMFNINSIYIDFTNSTVQSKNNFDLIYSLTRITVTYLAGTQLLMDGKLLRYGNSKKIFCHLKEVTNYNLKYAETYCPCNDTEDWYITPLQNITSLTIKIGTYTITSFISDEYESESVRIGNTKISLNKTDNFVLGILTPETIDIKLFELTKTVLFVSETILQFGDVQFNAAIYTKKNIKKLVLNCTDKMYNKTSQKCEDPTICDDVNCRYCPLIKTSCITCKSQFADGLCVNDETCLIVQFDEKCQICNTNNGYVNNNGTCVKSDINSEVTTNNNIVSCNKNYVLNTTNCLKCNEFFTNAEICENGIATKCDSSSKMNINGICEKNDCVLPNDQNGKCTTIIDNCQYFLNGRCDECENDFILSNNTCKKYGEQNCNVQNIFGCWRCDNIYYLDKSTKQCKSCDPSCLMCFETSTKCLSCPQNTYLSNYKCNTNEELETKCDQYASFGSGCVVCKDGYYRVGLDCYKCDQKCGKCLNINSCLTCNSTNYKTIGGECMPQSDIVGCVVDVTQNGCPKCQDGYFTVNTNECQKCEQICLTCSSTNKCTSCDNSLVLLSNGKCVDLSLILKCNEITKSKCMKCSFWNEPSEDGTYCETQAVWWVIFLMVLLFIIIFVSLIVIIIITTKKIMQKLHKKEVEKTTTVFQMKRSNIHFVFLQNGICVSSKEINFNKNINEIPVNLESREVFCVGNNNKNVVKIQFTITSKFDKFNLKIRPEVVCFKKGYACEFEAVLIPFCTCQIKNTIQIVSKCLKKQEEIFNPIKVVGITQQTTRIDYEELKEENKLGEGSFGIVYKKKDDKKGQVEFEKEVSMLEKFRNEYIIHFYGAVFIPNKICMVTEFAQYGCLQDLIEHKKSDDIDMKLRIKMLLDAAKGISYLHENGILHRDIKPDNILVFSLDVKEKKCQYVDDQHDFHKGYWNTNLYGA